MIHLDTGFLIRALVRNSSEDVKFRAWLGSSADVGISSIAWAEFLCGPVGRKEVELAARVLPNRYPFTQGDAAVAARLFNLSGRAGAERSSIVW
jgi:predicted nucleic acid-binding protein